MPSTSLTRKGPDDQERGDAGGECVADLMVSDV